MMKSKRSIDKLKEKYAWNYIIILLLSVISVSIYIVIPYKYIPKPIIENTNISSLVKKDTLLKDNNIILSGKNLDNISAVYIDGDKVYDFKKIDNNQISFTLNKKYYEKTGDIKIYVKRTDGKFLSKKSNKLVLSVTNTND